MEKKISELLIVFNLATERHNAIHLLTNIGFVVGHTFKNKRRPDLGSHIYAECLLELEESYRDKLKQHANVLYILKENKAAKEARDEIALQQTDAHCRF